MDLATELRTAGLTVITGREGIGRRAALGIETRITQTGAGRTGASDVNDIAVPNRAVAYIERNARVWLLQDGPVVPDPNAVIYLAAYRESDITAEQTAALAVLDAVLRAAYGMSDADTTEADSVAPGDDTAPDAGENGDSDDEA